MAELTYREAVAAALRQEVARDGDVVLIGEDLRAGGVFEVVPRRSSFVHFLVTRPEIGAFIAAVGIFAFFLAVAPSFRSLSSLSTVLYASSTIGIMAVGVALLMNGGEFDLSAGVAVIAAALNASMISYQLGLNLWLVLQP